MANIIGVNFESIVDGDGVRVVIFFSGCDHRCKGCHNPASHDFSAGQAFTEEWSDRVIRYLQSTPYVRGVTLSGGDPMYSAEDITPFVERLRSEVPSASVWIYTGFTYEAVLGDQSMLRLLRLCDVLVDGPFILELRNPTIAYRGSSNQRIIDVRRSLDSGNVVLWNSSKNADFENHVPTPL